MRSTGPPGVCQNWLTHKLWVRKYLFFFPLVTFFSSECLLSFTRMGSLKHKMCLCVLTTRSTSIERIGVTPQSNLLSVIHSLQEPSSDSNIPFSLFLFFVCKILFANNLIIVLLILALHFFLAYTNNCYSTLVPLTDTHSHHNLTTYTLYPICTLRDRIQILWLFNYVHCNHNAKT